jgi:hypothetical protein
VGVGLSAVILLVAGGAVTVLVLTATVVVVNTLSRRVVTAVIVVARLGNDLEGGAVGQGGTGGAERISFTLGSTPSLLQGINLGLKHGSPLDEFRAPLSLAFFTLKEVRLELALEHKFFSKHASNSVMAVLRSTVIRASGELSVPMSVVVATGPRPLGTTMYRGGGACLAPTVAAAFAN